jgi:UDP-N-acetylglucosamine:LPS N-acetylglucosamine transferase
LTRDRRIVVIGAGYGGGHEAIAEALADYLRRRRDARVRVASLDVLTRCAPRSARLASIAFRGGEEFFPDGVGTLSAIASRMPEDPLVRELVGGGIASAGSALTALEPDLVLAAHPIAGAIAAEVAPMGGFPVMSVIGDLWPERVWLHPGVALYFVGGPAARDSLAAKGLEWARAVISGVPVAEPPSRAAARRHLGGATPLDDRFTVLVDVQEAAPAMAQDLTALGIRVLVRAGAPGRPPPSANTCTVGNDEASGTLIAASDLVVCAPCGSAVWEAPAAGVPIVVVEPVTPMERSTIDFLDTAGAAVIARGPADAVRRIGLLAGDPERVASMSRDAASVGRPLATRAVCERVMAEVP